jgi:tetratricopeptide (TPR) repeat protein
MRRWQLPAGVCVAACLMSCSAALRPSPLPQQAAASRAARLEESDRLKKDFDRLLDAGDLESATKVARQNLALREQLFDADSRSIADALQNMALVLTFQRLDQEAEADYRRALRLFDVPHQGEAGPEVLPDVLRGLCLLLYWQGHYDEAQHHCERAVDLTEKSGDEKQLARSLAFLAEVYRYKGDYAAARPLSDRAVSIAERVYSPSWDLANILNNQALLADLVDDFAAARDLYGRVLKIEAQWPDHPNTASTLGNLGVVLEAQGEFEQARQYYERALRIRRKALAADHPQILESLSYLAHLAANQGDFSSAEALYQQVLDARLRAPGPPNPDLADAYGDVASMAVERGDLARGKDLSERALAIERPSGTRGLATTLLNYAVMLGTGGEYAQAETVFAEAQSLLEKQGGAETARVAGLRHHRAALYVREGKLEAAETDEREVLRIREAVLGPDHPDVARSLHELARIELRRAAVMPGTSSEKAPGFTTVLGQLLKSAVILDRYMARILPSLSSEEQRLAVAEDVPAIQSSILSVAQSGPGLVEGYGLILQWKGLLLDFLRWQSLLSSLRHAELTETVDRLQGTRSQLAGVYHKAGSLPPVEWQRQLEVLTRQAEALERELAQRGATDSRDRPLPITLADLQAVLHTGEWFADCYRYRQFAGGKDEPERYVVILTSSRSSPRRVDLGDAALLGGAVEEWRLAVLSQSVQVEEAWRKLQSLLWKPLLSALPRGAGVILVSPDSKLLPTGNPPRTMTVNQIDSARALVRLRHQASRAPAHGSTPPRWLLMGDVDFNVGGASKTPVRHYESLPGAADEVADLEKLGTGEGLTADVLTGRQATKQELITRLSLAAYAHLATHGIFMPQFAAAQDRPSGKHPEGYRFRNPLVESGLALVGVNFRDESSTEEPGILTAQEIVGLDLRRSRLITLSACDTARGEALIGQGVWGLRGALTTAGAHSVLLALWPVPDDATHLFMHQFYLNLFGKHLSQVEALVRAQTAVREDPSANFANPYFWAAWILVGVDD